MPGEFFGEIALTTKQKRTASLISETNCYFLTLNQKNFIKL